MQFINIVVHSVEDMNFRVHLQYDFTKLSLDDYLDVSWYVMRRKKGTDRQNTPALKIQLRPENTVGCHYSTPETATTEKESIMAFPVF